MNIIIPNLGIPKYKVFLMKVLLMLKKEVVKAQSTKLEKNI